MVCRKIRELRVFSEFRFQFGAGKGYEKDTSRQLKKEVVGMLNP